MISLHWIIPIEPQLSVEVIFWPSGDIACYGYFATHGPEPDFLMMDLSDGPQRELGSQTA